MKKGIAIFVLIAMLLCGGFCYAELIDFSSFSQEELFYLRNDINARLIITQAKDKLYDEDGISVAWCGIEETKKSETENQYQIDFFISNQNDESVFLQFSNAAINGVLIGFSNDMAIEIPGHTSMYTAATNRWFFDTKMLESIRFSGEFESVAVTLKFYCPDANGKCSYKDLKTSFDARIVVSK